MATGKEYFIGEERFTPSQIRRLSRARKVEAMVQWFYSNYQDPVHETSYNSREGGYLWNHGGPHDADEELQDEFSDLADFEVIQDAVSEVTSDGIYQWAPARSDDDTYTDDDYDRDLRLREGEPDDGIYSIDEPLPDISDFIEDEQDADQLPELPPGQAYLTDENDRNLTDELGRALIADVPIGDIGGSSLNEFDINSPTYADASFVGSSVATDNSLPDQAGNAQAPVEALRLEMLSRLDQLELIMRQNHKVAPNRGHNHPPELVDIEPVVTQVQFQELMTAIADLKEQANNPTPDRSVVNARESALRRFGAWLVDASGNGIVGAGVGCGFTIIYQNQDAILHAVYSAADATMAWAQHLQVFL